MGLGISVGFLADMKQHDEEGLAWARKELDAICRYLEGEGLPTWEEPEELPPLGMRPHIDAFPYSTIHYLRRAYALAYEHPDQQPVKPVGGEGLEAYDALVADLSTMFSSHLLCHSDCEGWYLPVDFEDPLFAPEELGISGAGMLGSSYGLLRELRQVAPYIGIRLEADGSLSDAEAKRIYEEAAEDGPTWHELTAWLTLHEMARVSIKHRTAIHFH
jgi:hypothetical protein